MTTRTHDGSAGDVDYGTVGSGYSAYRRPDGRIARFIARALGEGRTVLNVGAGAGSYENIGGTVTAVEPSASMRAQRPNGLEAAVDAVAEDLPFADGSFDASMTLFSVHQWSDVAAGLREMRRVTSGPVVILTCDPTLVRDFWLYEYAPAVLDTEALRYPPLDEIAAALGGTVHVEAVPIPFDCTGCSGDHRQILTDRHCLPGRGESVDQGVGMGGYSQSFFLKTTYRLVHTTAISTTANGYPPAQCSSGMLSKFIP
ncbi:hypothetical protein SNARM312S_04107 [Streptomyces narbonensis]